MLRLILALSTAFMFAGCASQIQLTDGLYSKPSNVSIVDHRSPDKKARRHDALFSPILFIDDATFSPRALDLYTSSLASAADQSLQLKLEVEEFRIIDFYPARLGSGGRGLIGAAIVESLAEKNTDWSFVKDMHLDRTSDAVACIVMGRLNGSPVKVAVSERYKTSPFAGLVYNDPDFRRALDSVLKRAASETLRQALLLK